MRIVSPVLRSQRFTNNRFTNPLVYTRQDPGHGTHLVTVANQYPDVNLISFPSPPLPAGWPLSWVKSAVYFPEDQLRQLRGIDATIYVRFLRGCCEFHHASMEDITAEQR
jgi:hypothetical protein